MWGVCVGGGCVCGVCVWEEGVCVGCVCGRRGDCKCAYIHIIQEWSSTQAWYTVTKGPTVGKFCNHTL